MGIQGITREFKGIQGITREYKGLENSPKKACALIG